MPLTQAREVNHHRIRTRHLSDVDVKIKGRKCEALLPLGHDSRWDAGAKGT
jgi:hypothetical protein